MTDLDWSLIFIGKMAMVFVIIFACALVISEMVTKGYDNFTRYLEHRRENKAFAERMKEEAEDK